MHAPCLADAMEAFNLVLPCLDAVSLVVVAFASSSARRAAREELEHRLGCSCYLALPCVDGTDRHSAAKRLDYDSDCESISEAPRLHWPDAGRLRAFQCVSYHRCETMNLTWRDGCLRPADGAHAVFSWRGHASVVWLLERLTIQPIWQLRS